MKKHVFTLISCLLFTSCDSASESQSSLPLIDENLSYFVYAFEDTSCLYEKYYLIEDGKTKIFTNKDDYKAFEKLFDNKPLTEEYYYFREINNNKQEIDFSKYNVGITATYVDHSDSHFDVTSITLNDNIITQNITITTTIPSVHQSSYMFLYTIFDKSITPTFKTNYKEIADYDQTKCYKPILYFYPESEMSLTVSFKDASRLLTTYPKYDNGWKINIKEDGTFTCDGSNREYYALYFDEIANYKCDFSEGFYVTSDNAISFLEEKLDYIGYNNKEANEFMMYWLPLLEENEKSLVYFEQTDIRNKECELVFSTTPDTLIRTIIHIKKVDKEIDIKPQELVSYNRKGFVVVEWGGTYYE